MGIIETSTSQPWRGSSVLISKRIYLDGNASFPTTIDILQADAWDKTGHDLSMMGC